PGDAADTILGDLYEEFDARGGSRRAAWWFWRQTVSLGVRYAGRGGAAAAVNREDRHMWIDHLRQDVKFAVRSYVKTPSFTIIVVATLALGIGASTAIFSLVDGILVKPLPFPDPDRLVFISELNGGGGMSVSWPNFLDWRTRVRTLEGLAASRSDAFTLTGGGRAERLIGRRVTSS